MGPLLVIFLVIGAALATRLQPLILLGGWIAVQYGFLAGIPYENIRFALAIVPPLAVMIGMGAAWPILAQNRLQLLIAPFVVLIVIYSLVATLRTSIPIFAGWVAAQDADLDASRWIEQHIPEPGATVYCLDLLLIMEHYTQLHPVQIYLMKPEQLSVQLERGHSDYAVFNLWTTEHQWYGLSPWIIYHWLLGRGMTEIGTHGNYTL